MSFKRIVDTATLRAAVVRGATGEGAFLDFKREYRWQKPYSKEQRDGQPEEFCRDVAQFANSYGGTLLVGVDEVVGADGRRVAGAVHHVADVDGFRGWTEQAIRNNLTPSTFRRSFDVINLDEGTIVAINVQPSLHLCALWRTDLKRGIEYLYRTDHGKQWMNPDEVERHIMDGSRALRIELTRVLAEFVGESSKTSIAVELTPPVRESKMQRIPEPHKTLENASCQVSISTIHQREREIELRVGHGGRVLCVCIPHGLIRDVWITTQGNVGLCLGVSLVLRYGDIFLDQ